MSKIKYPLNCEAIIDVTKAPYSADNTGRVDCTDILNSVIRDFYMEYLARFNETDAKLSSEEDPNALITFEIRKVSGKKNVIFPEKLPPARIIYFPDGEYLVSDTISYYFSEFRNILEDNRHLEMNAVLRFCGESEHGTVIRLADNCPGFQLGSDKPVISFMQGRASNISQSNMFENMTINVGCGNPGATGLVYFANNSGAVRNVTIRSADPGGLGNTGFAVVHDKVSAGYVKNLTVEGFNYGIKVLPQTHFITFEHVTIRRQRHVGIYIGNTVVSIRDLKSDNEVTAVWLHGVSGFTALIDAELHGGRYSLPAVRYEFGQCLLRNINASGYEYLLTPKLTFGSFTGACYENHLDEYASHGPVQLSESGGGHTLNLPVEETPDVPWPLQDDWLCVNDCGAVGDGVSDDTAAIQAALDSGKASIWFQPGRYLINKSVKVPAGVQRINFMYCDLISGDELKKARDTGVFVVVEESGDPLLLEDLMAWESFNGHMSLIDHACKRTLIVSDIHCQGATAYFNSVPGGKVFIEDVCCTVGGIPGAGTRKQKLKFEEKFDYSREKPCFAFTGQTVYCRQINPERSLYEIVNDGGLLWILGFKTEEEGTAFYTKNGGKTEVIGGSHCVGMGLPVPLIVNEDSDVSVFSSTCIYSTTSGFPVAVRESGGGKTLVLADSDMPVRFMTSYTFPPYVGYAGKHAGRDRRI